MKPVTLICLAPRLVAPGLSVLLLALATGHLFGQAVTNTLVPAGAFWKFLDDGSDLGAGWRAPEFDDALWPCGFAELGFGEFDEETVLYPGPVNDQFITYYFRTTFVPQGGVPYASLTLDVLRDDGVVVYLNGIHVWRNNMPAGAITYRTLASTNVTGAGERTFHSASIPPSALRAGTNVLAVEVHQSSRTSGDLSFDLRLSGVGEAPRIVRGPYLQMGGTTSLVVRWRTSVACDSQVRFGLADGEWDRSVSDSDATTEHEVRLTGLAPDTYYSYAIGTTAAVLAADDSYFFVTAPARAKPTRIWVVGDSGTKDSRPRSVYNAYRNFTGPRYTDAWLMLGDNAYGIGTDEEYQAAVFDMFPELLRQTVLWSTIGNHETYSGTFADFPYLHIFSLPQGAEAGGLASGTERYYSFDYGNIHLVCLDAMTSDRSSNGPMATWLRQDLAANTNEWIIAFWHHPPYTKGTHDSDFEGELIQMRASFVPILESYGVDLVLCGHSHCYERSFLINGHYGSTGTFDASMKIDGGSGREEETGAYVKPELGPGANQGAVFVVAGNSGQATTGSFDHPVMFYNAGTLGSLVLDIDGPTLQARFLRETGAIDDHFTIIKGAAAKVLRLVAFDIADGRLTLRWNSRTGMNYLIERTTSLAQPNWLEITSGLAGSGATMAHAVPLNASPAGAFFRVREVGD